MSLASQLDRYLAVRRSLGYDLRTSERVLRRFIRFADDTGAKHVDPDLFLRWDASQPIAGSSTEIYRGAEYSTNMVPKIKVEVVCDDALASRVVEAVQQAANSGAIGDGKIFVLDVGQAVRIRTGETGDTAL